MSDTAEKLRALWLAALVVSSVVAVTVSLGGAAAAANTAGNVSLSISAAGNQATVAVDDSDLNTASNTVESVTVKVNSSSESATASKQTGSDTPDGATQTVTISSVYDRNQDGSIDAADFNLSGAGDEVISSVTGNSGSADVTVEDLGSTISDGKVETIRYTRLAVDSTGSDTTSSQQITTSSPVGDRNQDGVVDVNDVELLTPASSESITGFTRNADGTATVTISDSSDTDTNPEQIRYLPAETVVLSETGQDTGTFTGSIAISQSTGVDGELYAQDGDDISTTYYDQRPAAARVASETLSLGGGSNTWINGTVADSNGAIEGADVYAISSGGEVSDTTDASGVYNISISSGTRYDVVADNHPDHQFESRSGYTVSAGNTQVVDFQLTAYPEKGTINGTVLDSAGNPVRNVDVSARELGYRFGNSTTTNASGEFTLTVPAADYRMRASPPPRSDVPAQTRRNVTVTAGQTTDVTFTAPETGYIAGTVENASGDPQTQGVAVIAQGDTRTLYNRTNASGGYNITAPEGDYTVSVFARGGTSQSEDVSVSADTVDVTDFTLRNTTVVDSSLEVISGASGVNTGDLELRSTFRQGTLRAQVINTSKSQLPEGSVGAPGELETAGVTSTTEFRLNLTVTNFSANSLVWGINNSEWNTSDNASVTNGTDITVTGTPVTLQATFASAVGGRQNAFGPVFSDNPQWATGRSDTADAGRNQTLYFGLLDLSNLPGSVRNQLNGMSVTTNAQKFTVPRVENNSLEVWVGAPTATVNGNDHTGFYQAEIPQAQLDDWNITDPVSELNALYKGSQSEFTVTDTASGARIRLDNISYSAGYVEVEGDDTTPPTADAGSDRTVTEGDSLTFDGTGSSDSGTGVSTYEWDVDGDGTYELSGSQPSYTFSGSGTYTVELRVTDGAGNTATDTLTVDVQSSGGGGGGGGGTASTATPTATTTPTETATTTESTTEAVTDGGDGTDTPVDEPTDASTESRQTTEVSGSGESGDENDRRESTPRATSSGSGPGFGVVATLVVLLVIVLAARRD